MSRKFKIVFLLVVILLQLSVLAHFKPFSVVPNYTFAAIFAIALISPKSETVVIAGFAGLLLDLFSGAPLGLNTLIYIYMTIGCIIVSEAIYTKNPIIMSGLCFVFSFVFELIYGVCSTLLRGAGFSFDIIGNIVLPAAGVNTVVFFLMYMVLRKLRFEKRRKGIKYER